MISRILNNIPNIDNKKKENMQTLKQSNFSNLANKKKEKKVENFDDHMSSLYTRTLHSSDIPMNNKKEKTEVEITAEEDTDGEKKLSVLSAITTDEAAIPNKIPSVSGIDNADVNIDEVDVKKYELDWISTAYIGSISLLGVFIAYKAIKRTM